MKIQIASDLHLEFLRQRFPDYHGVATTGADVLVLAGDIDTGSNGLAAFAGWPVPVVYVHGNHEMYGEHYAPTVALMRQMAGPDSSQRDGPGGGAGEVRYLEQEEWFFGGVRFLGACLWTDYLLYGELRREDCMERANSGLNDHRLIRTGHGPFSARDALECHQASLAWLNGKLGEPFSGKTVVVTHHAPHPKSVHPRFAGDTLTAAFTSDLTQLIERHQPALWCHGHMHDSSDYKIGKTRVVANPRGYPVTRSVRAAGELEFENRGFKPGLVVDIG